MKNCLTHFSNCNRGKNVYIYIYHLFFKMYRYCARLLIYLNSESTSRLHCVRCLSKSTSTKVSLWSFDVGENKFMNHSIEIVCQTKSRNGPFTPANQGKAAFTPANQDEGVSHQPFSAIKTRRGCLKASQSRGKRSFKRIRLSS